MQIKILNPTEIPNWNDQIAQLPGATIFHTANWARVLAGSYNYRPCYFTAFTDGQMTGCIPMMEVKSILTGRRGVSLPFTDACRPLAGDAATFNAMWTATLDCGRKNAWKHIELRGPHAGYQSQPASAVFLTHSLPLDGPEAQILSQLRGSTQRNINKALKAGVAVCRSHSLESVRAFYRLNCITRKKHGLPPQPFKFFNQIHQHIIQPRRGFVQLATHGQEIIAGAVFFHFSNTVLYKYGASLDAYQQLRPNNLIMWAAVQWGLQNGCQRFDFGRTETDHAGLLQFKRGWGARETQLFYYRYRTRSAAFDPAAAGPKTSYALFERMPMPLLKLTGRILYRHMG